MRDLSERELDILRNIECRIDELREISKILSDAHNNGDLFLSVKQELDLVCRCIATHMGPWTTNYKGEEVLECPKDKYQRFVHMCDYLASRKFLDIKFDKNNNIINE